MAIPALRQPKLVKSYSRDIEGQEYTTYHRAYHMGRLSISEGSLDPRDGLPEDATRIIATSRMGKISGEASEVCIVVAKKGKYKTAERISGISQALFVMTRTSGDFFYPQMVGESITVLHGDPDYVTVTGYTDQSHVTVNVSDTIASGTGTFSYNAMELARTDYRRGIKTQYWTAIERFHADPDDVDDLVEDMWNSYIVLNSGNPTDETYAVAAAHGITVVDEDPNVLTMSLITVEYRTNYNPNKYPTSYATQEMITTGDTKRLLQDLGVPPLDIETEPDDDGYYTVVSEGSNIVPDPHAVFILRTAMTRDALDYDTLKEYTGTGNSLAFTKIAGGADAQTMLCIKSAVAEDYIDDGTDAYVPVQFWFAQYDDDLDNYCVVRMRRRRAQAEFLLHPTDNPKLLTDADRIYMQEDGTASAPGVSTNAKTRTVMMDTWAESTGNTVDSFLYSNFAFLDTLLSWG